MQIDPLNEPIPIVAERAARRAIEAISRAGTLNDDVAAIRADNIELRSRLTKLEGDLADLSAAFLLVLDRQAA